MIRYTLLILLCVVAVVFVAFWAVEARNQRQTDEREVVFDPLRIFIGWITNFFDQLGVGSFATTTPMFKFTKTVRDENIPGTLNVGHGLPTVAEALISISLIEVEPKTLALLILSAVLGAWLGAGVVSRLPRRQIQIGMAICLLGAAGFLFAGQMNWVVNGGSALELNGTKMIVGLVVIAILGALMTLGIGLFAPCMILVSLLGMNQKAAYPIMMGACAFLMPAASFRFIRSQRYDLKASIGLALGGVPGVLMAAWLVKEMPVYMVKWLVIGVVIFTSIMMLRSAAREKAELGLVEKAEPALTT